MQLLRGLKAGAAPGGAGFQARSIGARLRARLGPRQEGQALLELALVLPMIMVAVTGILIFGLYEIQVMALTEGVDNAGRVLAVSAGQTLDPCATAVTAVENAAPILNPNNLSFSIVLNPINPYAAGNNHTYTVTSCSSTSFATGAPSNLVSNGTVSVSATFNACSLNFYGNRLTPSGCSITQSIMEAVQ